MVDLAIVGHENQQVSNLYLEKAVEKRKEIL
jgi:hypothetical protein